MARHRITPQKGIPVERASIVLHRSNNARKPVFRPASRRNIDTGKERSLSREPALFRHRKTN
jgi:hypothetical protein